MAITLTLAHERVIVRGIREWAGRNADWLLLGYGRDAADVLRNPPPVDGVIAGWMPQAARSFLRQLGVPVVLVDQEPYDDLPVVQTDNHAIGRLAAEYLMDLGYEHFAYWGPTEDAYSRLRREGFLEGLEREGLSLSIDDLNEDESPSTICPWQGRLTKVLRGLGRPGAIFCDDIRHARDVEQLCRWLGLRIPEDVAVLGVDPDELLSELGNTPISTIDQGCHRIGAQAAELLSRLMDGQRPPTEPILVCQPEIIERRSTGWADAQDGYVARAMRLIRRDSSDRLTISRIAEELGISRRALEIRFRRVLGRTIHDQIVRWRIRLVKRLLRTTHLPLPDVAARTGFSSANHMTKVFKAATGLSPGAYRTEHRSMGDETSDSRLRASSPPDSASIEEA